MMTLQRNSDGFRSENRGKQGGCSRSDGGDKMREGRRSQRWRERACVRGLKGKGGTI